MKKAQIKFGETIGIIFVVYIVLVAGFMWYNNSNAKSVEELLNKDKKNRAFEKYNFVVNMDLIHQSRRSYVDEVFDLNSLRTIGNFSNTSEGRAYLQSRLGDAEIFIKLYEYDELGEVESDNITIYRNYPSSDYLYEWTSYKTLIPIRDYNVRKTHLGLLEVRVPIEQ